MKKFLFGAIFSYLLSYSIGCTYLMYKGGAFRVRGR